MPATWSEKGRQKATSGFTFPESSGNSFRAPSASAHPYIVQSARVIFTFLFFFSFPGRSARLYVSRVNWPAWVDYQNRTRKFVVFFFVLLRVVAASSRPTAASSPFISNAPADGNRWNKIKTEGKERVVVVVSSADSIDK